MSSFISEKVDSGVFEKAIAGSFFQVAGRFMLRFIKIFRTIIIARFLFPDDIGLFVLATSIIGLAELFLQSGFQSAIVQRSTVTRSHLDGVWTIHFVKNAVLGVSVYLAAPFAADFFAQDTLVPILQALAFIYFIEAFVNIGTVLFQKEMHFRRQFLYDASYVLTETVATIVLTYFLRDVWALVYGALIGRFASVIFSYTFQSYRPHFTRDFSGARDLFSFSKWIWLTGIFIFLISKIDLFVIGKLLNVSDLGHYQLALSLALIPAIEISRSLATVLFPLFSNLHGQNTLLTTTFIYAFQSIIALTVPMAAGLYVLSAPIVHVIYGLQWSAMVPLLKILSVYGLLKSFEYVFTSYLNSVGMSRMVSMITMIQTAVLVMAIYPLILMYGAQGAGYALILTTLTGLCLFVFCLARLRVRVPIRDCLYIVVPLAASGVMGLILYSILLYINVSLLSLILCVVCGAFVYLFTLIVMDTYCGKRYRDIVEKVVSRGSPNRFGGIMNSWFFRK